MERYICIHGHFYQPPRENPWLETVEPQDSAFPYHDWNERITDECYARNAASRILNEEKQIIKIVNNYSKISFNFGPTLMSWIADKFPNVYQAILDADKESQQRLEGHGNAIAQAYNHTILPLSNRRDKYTQIVWGIRDFVHRFQRQPEGFWMPEAAVDIESLEIMAEQGIKFTILAQRQAKRFRKLGTSAWQDVNGGQINPTMPYLLQLPHGRSIAIFFYDGAISQEVAFSSMLNNGENFANRLNDIFSDKLSQPQLAHIATDGETYGHHYAHGDMALAYALDYIERKNLAKITNYGHFLQKFPPSCEVEIIENSSWSCIHGIERWRSACGCNTGKQLDWHQNWRAPLKESFDWLRDNLIAVYEEKSPAFFKDSWNARNNYIDVIINRSDKALQEFFKTNASHALSDSEKQSALRLLEMQRHAMLMYTSCGWFFDDLSGIETAQVISYAARAIQLSEIFLSNSLEKQFLEKLSKSKSNLKNHGDGRSIYQKKIKPDTKESYFENINGRQRIVIEQVWPEIDNGRFPVKRFLNDEVVVEATVFTDGHGEISAVVKYRHHTNSEWQVTPLTALANDRWQARFKVTELGEYLYTISAWLNEFHSWRDNLLRWLESTTDVGVEILMGSEIIMAAAQRASANDAKRLQFFASALKKAQIPAVQTIILDPELLDLMNTYPNTENSVHYERQLKITVDREKARYSSWYEVFPRSLGTTQKPGSFQDLIAHLPYIAAMGFDVLYLPPIHPIGSTNRKGKNNHPTAQDSEPGSPWGVGAAAGGHTALHPQLGDFDDFQRLLSEAKKNNLEVALDLALQCSPDHPYINQHPEWFKHRPDGSIQYAENPPKKYQDIYPIDFESKQWPEIWLELFNIVEFWIKKGIRIFRVDNPHTKPFLFWEWLINKVRIQYPEVLFLAEAFTRPNIMYYLAKLGFSQSYTYFTWRNTKSELIQYLTELNKTVVSEFFRPNFWPNTPDILPEYLQTGGRPAFITRLILAATLASSYGIYGPAFELGINTPREPHSEEYLNSEKYEIIPWDLNQPDSLRKIITQVNTIRRENLGLHYNDNVCFHDIDNDQLLAYSKASQNNLLLIIVNLDPQNIQSGWLTLPLDFLEISDDQDYILHDLLDDARYDWHGPRNYIELNPNKMPAHIFKIELENGVPHE